MDAERELMMWQRVYEGAVLIQKVWRVYRERDTLASQRITYSVWQHEARSATRIQSLARVHLARQLVGRIRLENQRRELLRSAATVIQRHVRGMSGRARIQLMQNSSKSIANWFRLRRFLRMRYLAARRIQYSYRCHIFRYRMIQYGRRRRRLIRLQAWMRGLLARDVMRKRIYAACQIQARGRGFVCRQTYIPILDERRRSCVRLQTWLRTIFARTWMLRRMRRAGGAITVQAAVRGFLVR